MVEYINSPDLAPCVSFKLPVASHALRFIESLPDRKILWCVRDPREVVASMIRLQLRYSADTKLAWASHPEGAIREIRQTVEVLQEQLPAELADLMPSIGRWPDLLTTEDLNIIRTVCGQTARDYGYVF